MRQTVRRAILEASVLDVLRTANTGTRQELSSGLEPGDRMSAGDLGYVLLTNPDARWSITDPEAFLAWVMDERPDEIVMVPQVRATFIKAVLEGGEASDSAGVMTVPDGVQQVAGSPVLQVKPTAAAKSLAKQLLSGVKELEP
jgi:hypothetical protein